MSLKIWMAPWMVLGVLGMSPAAIAQDSPAGLEELRRQMEQMQQRMAEIDAENSALRKEVDQLRADSDDPWLTEARATEIRQLVTDVIADSESRMSLLQSGMTAGWNDGFFLASPDGNYKLAVNGQLQVRWVYNYHDAADANRSGFENTRTKLTFRGHVFSPDFNYLVRGGFERRSDTNLGDDFTDTPNAGGNFRLEDAWMRWDLDNQFSIKVGQFKLPFNREELVSSEMQLAVERSAVNQNLNIGRSQGIQLEYADKQFRIIGAFSDGGSEEVGGLADVGLGSTAPPANQAALRQDTEFAATGRFEWLVAGNWRQFQDFSSAQTDAFGLMAGVAVHHEQGEANGVFSFAQNETPWTVYTADVSAEFGGANLFASFTHHYFDRGGGDFRIWGAVIQGGVFVLPKWELFLRYEHGWWEFEGDDNFADLSLATAGWNYYFNGHALKLTTDFGVAFDQVELLWDSDIAGLRKEVDDAEPQIIIRTQFQLLF